MNAVSIGNLLANAASSPVSVAPVSFWRRTYDVSDKRADIARKLGDGSARQGKVVIATIIETAKAWFDDENRTARAEFAKAKGQHAEAATTSPAPAKGRIFKWNLLATLEAVLNFTNFKTGECIATYEMIADAANICRDTVYRHLNTLRDLKLIDWVRRCEPTGNKEGQKTKAAPNSYFFEITRLPSRVQMLMRQILKRRGVKLEAHPDRVGSGPVPNRAQRVASKLSKSLSYGARLIVGRKDRDVKMNEAQFIREEMALMADIPTERWAAIRYPNDLAAQASYNARLGIHSFHLESLETSLHSPLTELKDKD